MSPRNKSPYWFLSTNASSLTLGMLRFTDAHRGPIWVFYDSNASLVGITIDPCVKKSIQTWTFWRNELVLITVVSLVSTFQNPSCLPNRRHLRTSRCLTGQLWRDNRSTNHPRFTGTSFQERASALCCTIETFLKTQWKKEVPKHVFNTVVQSALLYIVF